MKTYWPYGVGVEIDRPTTGLEMNWVHVDRLGSPVAISDASGTLKEKLAYDAWGKRRTIDGAPISGTATPGTIDGATDNRGFTGHEMLDTLDLVHMNGRVYDPFLAHFLSADPLVQDPTNGQSYNRYSYVLNNPTNLTDPTGFACASTTGSRLEDCSGTGGSNSVQVDGDNRRSKDDSKSVPQREPQKSDGKGNNPVDPKNPGLAGNHGNSNDKALSVSVFKYDRGIWSSSGNVAEQERFVNGMNNTEAEAKAISEVEMVQKQRIEVFNLVHIPSVGFVNDLVRAQRDKLGWTTDTAREMGEILVKAPPGNWYTHSYGGVAFAEAVRTLTLQGKWFAGTSVTFLAGANNERATSRIMMRAGVQVNGYTGSWFDPVPNLVGLNTINPLKWAANIIASPLLMTPYSPHTHPPVVK